MNNPEYSMTISDWLVIAAMIIGPILAIQVQKFIEYRNLKRERKMYVFKTLMATRGTRLSPLHVEALNMIDIEFYDTNEVVAAWKLLLDNFYHYPTDRQDPSYEAKLIACSEKSKDLLVDLLYEISQVLNYKFDKVHLKRGCYTPVGHGEVEFEQQFIRKSFVELFSGRKTFPVKIIDDNPYK